MNFLHPKNIFQTFSPIHRLNGKRFISYHIKFQLTSIYLCSNIKYWTIFFYLNKQLYIFNKTDSKLCSYCRLHNETTNHIFVECKCTIKFWSDVRDYCQCSFDLPILNLHSAVFGFFEVDPDAFKPHKLMLLNHILLLYKYYIYLSRQETLQSFHLQP